MRCFDPNSKLVEGKCTCAPGMKLSLRGICEKCSVAGCEECKVESET